MNTGQDMSPDFVLMRLVSAAEEDRLDDENGNLSSGTGVVAGFGQEVLNHENVKAKLDCAQNQVGLSHLSVGNKALQSSGSEAPDAVGMATRASLPVPSPALHSAEARAYDLSHRSGIGPQLLVFRNVSRDADGLSENSADDKQASRAFEKQMTNISESSAGTNENTLSTVDAQHQYHPPWALHSQLKLNTVDTKRAELCHRHRIITDKRDWPQIVEKSNSTAVLDPSWNMRAQSDFQLTDRPVLELARQFGELGVAPVPDFLLKDADLKHCSCTTTTGIRQGEDPTETSDALLVLEGLGSEEVNGLGMRNNPDSQDCAQVKTQLALKCFPSVISGQAVGVTCRDSEICCLVRGSLTMQAQGNTTESDSAQFLTPSTAKPTVEVRPYSASPILQAERSASASRAPCPRGGGEKPLKLPGKTRKGSLKNCLSKLFRTKSCSGSNSLLDKRPSVTFSISSDGSLVDMSSASCVEQDASSQPGLTRTQSVFSGAAFTPVFTGETVSLVDVDISQRGRNSPHPPTPPPPPRRSLSLLGLEFDTYASFWFLNTCYSVPDDIGGPQPGTFLVNVMGASLQSLPLPLPPPPPLHATIQHSLSLNDAFLRALPHSTPSPIETPPPIRVAPPANVCPLRRVDSSSFTASLRELERCGWYWGPMNWEDAELKLKGKPDGSFLVRDSSDPRYILSLSFRSQGVTHHTRMEHYRGTFSLWCHPKFEDRCHSVVEFIERAIMHSKNGKFLYFLRSRVPGLPPTPVQLLYPVSRFCNVKSLQHLCRFCIRQLVRIDHIQELPLPKPLISYLKKFYYYDPEEEMYLSIKGMRQMASVEQEPESET
ncbi:Suppressor of cytokine signaling 7 [Bagarius yarrelli]|uniref:Suppressor of cytokine signaling 7 n=1 Tax=Bagarius yarrelli TaxID=175774 RepID=A0A556V2D4_BAGYA|nr:Suppressor of cytokine signaling 7 [Bagarius yarrelli]